MSIGVKWERGGYGYDHWVNDRNEIVPLKGNFHALHEGRRILVVMSTHRVPAGHGEPSFDFDVPNYLDATTLEDLKLNKPLIEPRDSAFPVSTQEQCRLAVAELLRLQPSLSYNDSYCGEKAGSVKSAVAEWARQIVPPTNKTDDH